MIILCNIIVLLIAVAAIQINKETFKTSQNPNVCFYKCLIYLICLESVLSIGMIVSHYLDSVIGLVLATMFLALSVIPVNFISYFVYSKMKNKYKIVHSTLTVIIFCFLFSLIPIYESYTIWTTICIIIGFICISIHSFRNLKKKEAFIFCLLLFLVLFLIGSLAGIINHMQHEDKLGNYIYYSIMLNTVAAIVLQDNKKYKAN